MNFVEPETWPGTAYFSLGAVCGLIGGGLVAVFSHVRLAAAFAITGGAALLWGVLAVILREHFIEVFRRYR